MADRLPPGFGPIWSAVALDLVGFGIVLPLLPLYAEREQFSASPVQIGLLVASFSLAQLVFSPLWGRVSDRYGRRPVLLVSMAGTAVGSLLTGLAPNLAVLFLGRIVDGISGASVSVAQAAVVDVAPARDRARLLGYLGAAFGLGFVAGPAIGALAALGGPHIPFLVAAALAALNFAVAWRRLPETHPRRTGVVPDDGVTLDSHGLAMSARLVVVAFIALLAFSAFEATFALFGARRLGLGLASAGGVFAAVGVVIALVQGGLVRPVVARVGEWGTARLGLVINAIGLALLAPARTWTSVVPALLLLTVGQGLAMPAITSVVASRAHIDRRGAALGVQQAAGGLARTVGPAAGGALFQHVGIGSPYSAGAALMVAAALLASHRDRAGGSTPPNM